MQPNNGGLTTLKRLTIRFSFFITALTLGFLLLFQVGNLEQGYENSTTKQILDGPTHLDRQVEGSFDIFIQEYQKQKDKEPDQISKSKSLEAKEARPNQSEQSQTVSMSSDRLERRLKKIDDFISEHRVVEQLNSQGTTESLRKKFFWLLEEKTRILMLLAENEIAKTDSIIKERQR